MSTPTTDAPSSSSDASPSIPPADSWEDEADNGEGMLHQLVNFYSGGVLLIITTNW